MKTNLFKILGSLAVASLSLVPFGVKAQEIQFYRPNGQQGVNVFETSKADTVPFKGVHVKVGGNFELTFQALGQSNTAVAVPLSSTNPANSTSLIALTHGFTLPMANLNIDVQLADGIRMNLTQYLAARHHEDTWVKGGYIQFDKLPFLHSAVIDDIMKSVTIKIGQNDVDYGDQHYRRTDGGNTIYNPFVENYIMDEFSTELGAQFYYFNKTGFFAMFGITDGLLNETVVQSTKVDALTGKPLKYDPAILAKLGFDKQVNKDFRFRLTGSIYTVSSTYSNTLLSGDRTGSHYYNLMENQAVANATTLNDAVDYSFTSGRFNPGFSNELHAAMGNLFLKYKGLEFFGTAENITGRGAAELHKRWATQYAGDVIYRFPENTENFWLGVRYNTVTGDVLNIGDVTTNRTAGSFGWFLTKHVMMKAEYVSQEYKNYPTTSILNGGKFHGVMLEASIGF
ncbi:hypothetical protein [Mucilaginibacter gotjawali]|uniref:Uncharacterized protein n=2 Tax=Mucilaginibacter gotjawali TaxID=1550579 RepID=A0A110B2D0_9SPHI|nr:hypothetical protein [Mucilaginibacter gotjawali]MBB3058020.1 hypothetical protein [Mucilaginibacter gotjawali]BAU51996.1 hypothetical protein MgSA37_00146 [Mucilaginibacter gotjawali]